MLTATFSCCLVFKTKYTHTFWTLISMIAAHILSIALAGLFKTYISATRYILDLYYTCKLIAQNLSMTIIGKNVKQLYLPVLFYLKWFLGTNA